MNSIDSVFADHRLNKARRDRANWIQSERIHAELNATGSTVRALRQTDPDFQTALDLAVAALLRDPTGSMSHTQRINAIFSAAVGRRAESEWDQRSAA
jgi:hypothetical protein